MKITNKIIKKIKNSSIYNVLVYIRYFFKRYILNFRLKNYYIKESIKLEPVDPEGVTFFGYYNISPQNNSGDIIYLIVKNEKKRGSLQEPASIMLKDNKGDISKITESKAWNWQQGCMLQWYKDSDDKIIYNDYSKEFNKYISIIMNINNGEKQIIDSPVYSVSSSGKFALTLNFSRLALMRPDYGYFNKNISWANLPEDKSDGIWYIDLEKNKSELIISLEKLKNLDYSETMKDARHKVNHIDIAPDDQRFMFLHRWIGPSGRFMRLVTADCNGNNIEILNGDIMTSHCCWLNSSEILSFCEYEGKRGYFKFIDQSNKVELLSEKLPKFDGHPSISLDGRWIVTDSYPDKSRFSNLYLYDLKNDKIDIIGKFYQPIRYNGEKRIDLHPKWGRKNRTLFIESGHKSNRKIFKILY